MIENVSLTIRSYFLLWLFLDGGSCYELRWASLELKEDLEDFTSWSVGGRLEPRLNLDSPQRVVIVGFGT